MLFYLLLPVAMLITISDCRFGRIINRCNDVVSFELRETTQVNKPGDELEMAAIQPVKRYNLLRNGMQRFPIPVGIYHLDMYVKILHNFDENNCIGDENDGDPRTIVRARLLRERLDFQGDEYGVDIRDGYNIPVGIWFDSNFPVLRCENILCNVTLDGCPTNENYGIGDLRVVEDNHTVACQSACRKRRVDNITLSGSEDNANHCPLEDFSQLRYAKMVKRKCPESSSIGDEPADAFVVNRKCFTMNNFHVITCP